MELGLNGLPRMTTKELAAYLSLTGEERRKFDATRARPMEEMEQEEQIDLAIARLSQMGPNDHVRRAGHRNNRS